MFLRIWSSCTNTFLAANTSYACKGAHLIETLFSIVRTARGTGGVLDILQLRHRLDVVAQLDELFAL